MIFVALLRAINLGRVNRVPMGDLRLALTDVGFTDVVTHLQSGNVVLGSTKRSPAAVATSVERLVAREFGVDTDIVVRTAGEFAKVASKHPLARRGKDSAVLHVAFLKTRPPTAAKRAFAERTFGADEFVIRNTEVYLRYPQGVAASKMNAALFQGGLGTPATVRTWKVVTRLNELVAAGRRS